jgi:DNA-binding MarR family transcriptional regulator
MTVSDRTRFAMLQGSTTEVVLERLIIAGVALTARSLEATAGELTFLQWRVLVVLGEAPTGLHVGEIGRRIGASAPSATRVLRRLERQGLIGTQREEADRRRVLVQLTADGQGLRREVMEHRRSLLREALRQAMVQLEAEHLASLERIAIALEAGP